VNEARGALQVNGVDKEVRNSAWRKLRAGIVLLGIALLGMVAIVGGIRFAFDYFLRTNAPKRFTSHVANPREEFEKATGLQCPLSSQLILSEDTHGGLQGDGTLCIAWTMKQDVVGRWLAGQPPWNVKEWERGPVPSHMGVHCSLETRPVWVVSDATAPRYGGDQQLQQLLGSKDVRYAAKNRGPSSHPWHNGNLLIVDTTTNSAWLFVWDM